jgi:superfamily II DNA/RNA helicase
MALQGPKALVLSPTRELAIQIHQEVQKYSYRGIRRFVGFFYDLKIVSV